MWFLGKDETFLEGIIEPLPSIILDVKFNSKLITFVSKEVT